ncbi:polysaccharide biosynthesis/export family protein [Chelatococcus sp. SYSU_G07232]|uniref:Polysaccharide biosynthesis/export family protein n=1 Tax=Chelatococcus albus TaxID=3047466 RepID=A0ABT7AEM1_9HYPH|nr:polysaccharide biosynthesis/export family protein [Chelatococcus sp. SYSU_G07232]MDJ1157076.1 polysaccharide biosynthesis/export family protein [Chelatococcus sp. SYSU_G07232]
MRQPQRENGPPVGMNRRAAAVSQIARPGAPPDRRAPRRRFLAARALALGLAMLAGGLAWADPGAEHRLGPQDKLRIKVNEWRALKGEVFEWTALNGEYTVGAGGAIDLPLVGSIPAAGLATSELAKAIAERLQAKVGLVERPDASVEVVQFRPFFVTGKVDRPGEYPYRPGLTVLQAVAIAGGLQRTTDIGLMRLEREAITARGDLRLLGLDMRAMVARRARLEAELNESETIAFPEDLLTQQAHPLVAQLMEQERLIFTARREALRTQVETLMQLKDFLQKELVSLRAQLETEDRQLKLIQKELQSVGSLVDRGLAIAPRQLSLERTLAQIEGDKLRVGTSILRAQQETNKTDMAILELRNKRRNEVVVELRQTQAKIEELTHRTDTAQKLMFESEVSAPQMLADRARSARAEPSYSIVRRVGEEMRETDVTETTSMQPGDILRVRLPLDTDRLQPARPTGPGLSAAPAGSETEAALRGEGRVETR